MGTTEKDPDGMVDGLFNCFAYENRPLSAELWRRASTNISDVISSARSVSDLDAVEGERLIETIEALRPAPPRLLGTRAADVRAGSWRWNEDQTSKTQTTRHFVAVGVAGDADLLRWWPDETSAELKPVDFETVGEAGGLDELAYGAPEDVRRYWEASQTWTLGVTDSQTDAEVQLFTYVDLTLDDERAVADGDWDLAEVFQRRRDRIAPIVEAIARQTDEFFDTVLPNRVREVVAQKRLVLVNRAAVSRRLKFPDAWHVSPPALAEADSGTVVSAGQQAARGATAQAQQQVPAAAPVTIDSRDRLADATFADVLGVMRLWADAVERFPSAFGPLEEDRISDLLAATLNATLPGAQREVYTRSGRSDIFVYADAIRAGRGPARVFICEAKWARSHKVVADALDPQLFGYLNVHDTAAVVLVLLPQQEFESARRTYLEVLEGVDGHQRTESGPIDGWPLLRFQLGERNVEVCAAFVHLPT